MLDAISRSWSQNKLVIAAQAKNDRYLWESVKASLDDCKTTLEKLDVKLGEVQKGGFLDRSFLRKPAMAVKLNLRMKDIIVFRQQMHSYNNAMQSALQMINM